MPSAVQINPDPRMPGQAHIDLAQHNDRISPLTLAGWRIVAARSWRDDPPTTAPGGPNGPLVQRLYLEVDEEAGTGLSKARWNAVAGGVGAWGAWFADQVARRMADEPSAISSEEIKGSLTDCATAIAAKLEHLDRVEEINRRYRDGEGMRLVRDLVRDLKAAAEAKPHDPETARLIERAAVWLTTGAGAPPDSTVECDRGRHG